MINSKKFIVVQSESIANQLIANGFILLSRIDGTYTFVNRDMENFNFSGVDAAKIHFTNRLCI